MRTVLFGVAVAVAAVPTQVLAQSWGPAAPRAAKVGMIGQRIASFDGNTAGAMVRCEAGQIEFLLLDASGETHHGASTLKVGGRSFPITFTNDPQLRQALGIPGSWAAIPPDAAAAMARAKEAVFDNAVRPTSGQPYISTVKIPLNGFPAVWKAAAARCGGAQQAGARPASSTSAADGPLPSAVARARDRYAAECRTSGGRNGRFASGGILRGDFNGDGVPDFVFDLNKYECDGGPAGGGFCGSSGCSIDVLISNGGSYRQDGWIGMDGAQIVKAAGGDRIRLEGRRGGPVTMRWSGAGFVRQ